MALNATTAIFIDKYHPQKINKNKCAVSIKITHNRIKRYYPTKFSLTVEEWTRMLGERPRAELKTILLQLQSLEKKASDIIDKMEYFSFEAFEKVFVQNRGLSNTVNYAFDEYIKELQKEEREGSAAVYDVAQTSLNKYAVERKMLVKSYQDEKGEHKFISHYTFSQVTKGFLNEYEKWMVANENNLTTVGIYLRSLRKLFNDAIRNGLIGKDFYPFGKGRYEIPTGKNTKKALKLSDLAQLYNYAADPDSTTKRMQDYWFFIYYCNGLNVKDLCRLKFKNLQDEFLVFQRAKTINTKRTYQDIRIPINEDVRAIIDRHGNKAISPEAYIFPILQPGITAKRERQLIQQFTRLINDHTKVIAQACGINAKTTTYAARHSFATVLKRSGASMEFISESLGHASLATTKAYLDSFEDDQKKEHAKALIAFKNVS